MPWNTEENLWRQACGEPEGVRLGWAPFLSTVVTLPVACFAFALAGLHAMLCDSCEGEVADDFSRDFGYAMTAFCVVIGLSLVLLITAWVLPRTERNRGVRIVLALLAPLVVVLGYAVFTSAVSGFPTG
jgi:hypothetical protein